MTLPGAEKTIACRFTRGPDGRSKHAGDIKDPDDRFGAPWGLGDGWYWWVEKHRFAVIWMPPGQLGVMVRCLDRKLWADEECLAELAQVQLVIGAIEMLKALLAVARCT